MNCIFICCFINENYIKMLLMLLESIYIYGNLNDDTDILIYTSIDFSNKIKASHLFNKKIKFEINDNIKFVEELYFENIRLACRSRYDFFKLESSSKYGKVLYLDLDILVKGDLNNVFDLAKKNIIYVLEEGKIDSSSNDKSHWGKELFGDEVNNYEDKTAFTSGIILFNNCNKVKFLFEKSVETMITETRESIRLNDQPYLIYNAFKYQLYDNKILKNFAVNRDYDVNSSKTIHHFPGGPGCYKNKINNIPEFLKELKECTINLNIKKTKEFIDENLFPIINDCNEPLEGNIFTYPRTIKYKEGAYLNRQKNISNLVLNKNIKNVLEIGFNSGFSALLMLISNPLLKITCIDLCEHTYSLPCYKKIKSFFGDRIKMITGDSIKVLQNINYKYDLIHIDGGNSSGIIKSDIINSYRLSKPGTILIMNDYNLKNIRYLWNMYINLYDLKNLDIHVYKSPHHDIKYVPVTFTKNSNGDSDIGKFLDSILNSDTDVNKIVEDVVETSGNN